MILALCPAGSPRAGNDVAVSGCGHHQGKPWVLSHDSQDRERWRLGASPYGSQWGSVIAGGTGVNLTKLEGHTQKAMSQIVLKLLWLIEPWRGPTLPREGLPTLSRCIVLPIGG